MATDQTTTTTNRNIQRHQHQQQLHQIALLHDLRTMRRRPQCCRYRYRPPLQYRTHRCTNHKYSHRTAHSSIPMVHMDRTHHNLPNCIIWKCPRARPALEASSIPEIRHRYLIHKQCCIQLYWLPLITVHHPISDISEWTEMIGIPIVIQPTSPTMEFSLLYPFQMITNYSKPPAIKNSKYYFSEMPAFAVLHTHTNTHRKHTTYSLNQNILKKTGAFHTRW